MTATVLDILMIKGTSVVAVHPSACVADAVALMDRHDVGSLMVTEGGPLLGVVSERDILRQVVGTHRDPERTEVSEIMTRSPWMVTPETSVDAAKELVTSTHCRHLPVLGPGGIAGVISSGDLAAWDLRSLRREVLQMTAYIHGPVSTRPFALESVD
jgi:CBS domain-containing protein